MTLKSEYKVGDQVKITTWYLSLYPMWGNQVKDIPATIEKIVHKIIKSNAIDKDTKPIFVAKYGNCDKYDLFGFLIRFEGENQLYSVSQLGFDKT